MKVDVSFEREFDPGCNVSRRYAAGQDEDKCVGQATNAFDSNS